MSTEFQYDVFLSHSSKDKPVVREIAERLREAGLRLWFDEWVLKPGDSIPAKIEEGPLNFGFRISDFGFAQPGMSAQAFGSDWAQLACPAAACERRRRAGTCGSRNLRFRDPLNRERRFVPLRLDDDGKAGIAAELADNPRACHALLMVKVLSMSNTNASQW